MKQHFILLCLPLLQGASHLPSMPMPTQYANLEFYQKALQVWANVAQKVMACSHQPPPMPLPTQYHNLNFYQQALTIWEKINRTSPNGCPAEGNVLNIMPMPMPTQYRNLEFYQRALAAWEHVYTRVTTCHIELPAMPMPTQYRNLELYQQALTAWETAGSCQ